jgi:glycosyltransferase involved in cell wall biosynthesis
VKLAVVVQRYGAQINGGAELHARYIVELLAKHHTIEVLTTRASDYVTWRNEYVEGVETLRGVPIRRFSVSHERDPEQFGRDSVQVFDRMHSIADELAWLDSEGPTSPALIDYLRAHEADYDYVIFFSYRYYLAFHGIRAVSNKALLVPTAERDSALGLSVFGPIFRGVRALMYNSPEERAMIQTVAKNTHVPGVVVGVGSEVPRQTSPERFRQKYHLHDPFVLYVGRIDENKGCRELFSYFTSYRPRLGQRLTLVLIGNSILPIPKHSNIRHLGYVPDQDKFDALAAAELLAMPSYYESLSMVALEAWALGKPVLANGRCDVLRGQCIRSRAGLFYDSFDEFAETLFTLTTFKPLTESLGENGRRFYEQHYAWPVIERKYLDMLNQLAAEDAGAGARKATSIEPLPGWLARRRKTLPPAAEIVKALPHEVPREDRTHAPAAAVPAPATSATPRHAGAGAGVGASGASGATGSASSSSSSSESGDRERPRDRDRDRNRNREGQRDRDGRLRRRRPRPDGRGRDRDRGPSSSASSSGANGGEGGRNRPPRDARPGRSDRPRREPGEGGSSDRPRREPSEGGSSDSGSRPRREPGEGGSGESGSRPRREPGESGSGESGSRPRREQGESYGSSGESGSRSRREQSESGGSGDSGSRPRREPGAGNSGSGEGRDGDRQRRRRRRGGRSGPRGPREGS